MDAALAPRAVLLGYLTVTIPVIGAILAVVFFGLYMFGPFLFVYYAFAGVTVGWQWCSIALPRWKQYLRTKGAEENEIERFACRTGLAWPGVGTVGLFALHTTAAAACAIHLSPWLVGRWFGWIRPWTGVPDTTFAADYYLQHLEVLSVVPALAIGYLISTRFQRLARFKPKLNYRGYRPV
jgi:hypothetical protein